MLINGSARAQNQMSGAKIVAEHTFTAPTSRADRTKALGRRRFENFLEPCAIISTTIQDVDCMALIPRDLPQDPCVARLFISLALIRRLPTE